MRVFRKMSTNSRRLRTDPPPPPNGRNWTRKAAKATELSLASPIPLARGAILDTSVGHCDVCAAGRQQHTSFPSLSSLVPSFGRPERLSAVAGVHSLHLVVSTKKGLRPNCRQAERGVGGVVGDFETAAAAAQWRADQADLRF
jgi:hypothetical protein